MDPALSTPSGTVTRTCVARWLDPSAVVTVTPSSSDSMAVTTAPVVIDRPSASVATSRW